MVDKKYRLIYYKQKWYVFFNRHNKIFLILTKRIILNLLFFTILYVLISKISNNITEIIKISLDNFNAVVMTLFSICMATEIVILSFSKSNVLGIEKKDAFLKYNFKFPLSISSLDIFVLVYLIVYIIELLFGKSNAIYTFGIITILLSLLIIILSIIVLSKNELKIIIDYAKDGQVGYKALSADDAKKIIDILVKDNEIFSKILSLHMQSLDFTFMINCINIIKTRISNSTLSKKDISAFAIFIEEHNKHRDYYTILCVCYLSINLIIILLEDKEYKMYALQIIESLKLLLFSNHFKPIADYKYLDNLLKNQFKTNKLHSLINNIQASYVYVLTKITELVVPALENVLKNDKLLKNDIFTVNKVCDFIDQIQKRATSVINNAVKSDNG